MWWRILTFCVLTCLVLLIVLSCILGRPVTYLFFNRCCEDNIENDQVIFEKFDNNFLRERLVGDKNVIVDNNGTFATSEETDNIINKMRHQLNVHNPCSRVNLTYVNDENTDLKAIDQAKTQEITENVKVIDLVKAEVTKENVTVTDIVKTPVTTKSKKEKDLVKTQATTESEFTLYENAIPSSLVEDVSQEVTTEHLEWKDFDRNSEIIL